MTTAVEPVPKGDLMFSLGRSVARRIKALRQAVSYFRSKLGISEGLESARLRRGLIRSSEILHSLELKVQ